MATSPYSGVNFQDGYPLERALKVLQDNAADPMASVQAMLADKANFGIAKEPTAVAPPVTWADYSSKSNTYTKSAQGMKADFDRWNADVLQPYAAKAVPAAQRDKWIADVQQAAAPSLRAMPTRSFTQAVNDSDAYLGEALTGIPKSLADFGATDNAASKWFGDYQKSQQARLSDYALNNQLFEAEKSSLIANDDYLGIAKNTAADVITNPLRTASKITGNIAPFLAAAPLNLGIKGMTALSGLIGAGTVKGSIAENIDNATEQQLMSDPIYAVARQSGMSQEDAKSALKQQRASYEDAYGKIGIGGLIGAAVGRLGPVEQATAGVGRGTGGSLAKEVAKGALKEPLTEIPQEVSENYLANLGAGAGGAKIDPYQNLIEAGVQAGLMSVAPGAIAGGFSASPRAQTPSPVTPPTNQTNVPQGAAPQVTPQQSNTATTVNVQQAAVTPEAAAQRQKEVDFESDLTAYAALGEEQRSRAVQLATDVQDGLINIEDVNNEIKSVIKAARDATNAATGGQTGASNQTAPATQPNSANTASNANSAAASAVQGNGDIAITGNAETVSTDDGATVQGQAIGSTQSTGQQLERDGAGNATNSQPTQATGDVTYGTYNPTETGAAPNTEAVNRLLDRLISETSGQPVTIESATKLATEHEKGYSAWVDSNGNPDSARRSKDDFISGTVDNILATAVQRGTAINPAARRRGAKRLGEQITAVTRQELGDRRATDGTLMTEDAFQKSFRKPKNANPAITDNPTEPNSVSPAISSGVSVPDNNVPPDAGGRATMATGKEAAQPKAKADLAPSKLSFTTSNKEKVTGARLTNALNKVADDTASLERKGGSSVAQVITKQSYIESDKRAWEKQRELNEITPQLLHTAIIKGTLSTAVFDDKSYYVAGVVDGKAHRFQFKTEAAAKAFLKKHKDVAVADLTEARKRRDELMPQARDGRIDFLEGGGIQPKLLTAPTGADVPAQQRQRDAESQRREQGGDAPLPTRKVTADTPDMFNTQGSVFDVPAEVIIQDEGKDKADLSPEAKPVEQKRPPLFFRRYKLSEVQRVAKQLGIDPDKKSIGVLLDEIDVEYAKPLPTAKKFPTSNDSKLSKVEQKDNEAQQQQSQSPTARNPSNPKFSFAGISAATADRYSFNKASKALENGADPEIVRQETGWFKGADGKWRFEIDDSDAVLHTWIGATSAADLKNANGGEWINGADFSEKYPDSKLSAQIRREKELRKSINTEPKLGRVLVGEILSHDALFAAYPSMERVRILISDSVPIGEASYTPSTNSIIVSPMKIEDAKSAILHELQHNIQEIEGFASGGNLQTVTRANDELIQDVSIVEKILTDAIDLKKSDGWLYDGVSIEELIMEAADGGRFKKQHYEHALNVAKAGDAEITTFLNNTPFNQYKRLYGEVEARNTQTRQGMTAAERRAVSPESTQDVQPSDVIVTFNGNDMQSAPTPANIESIAASLTKNPSNQTAIRAAIERLLGGMKDAWARISQHTVVVDSVADLPEFAEAIGTNGQAFFVPSKVKGEQGKIYLIADRIEKGQEASVWLHEVGHKRLRELVGDEGMTRLYQGVQNWAKRDKTSDEYKIFKAADDRANKSGDYEGEVLYYAIEEANNLGVTPDASKGTLSAAGWLAKVNQLFEGALRKLLGGLAGNIDISANDLMAMAYGAAGLEISGRDNARYMLRLKNHVADEIRKNDEVFLRKKRFIKKWENNPIPNFLDIKDFESEKAWIIDTSEKLADYAGAWERPEGGNVTHSGSAAGASSYLKTNYFTNEIRVSRHSKGVFNSQFYVPVNDKLSAIDIAKKIKYAAESLAKKYNDELSVDVKESQGDGVVATSLTPFDGIEKARTPLGDTKTVTVDGKEYSVFNSDGKPIHGTVEGVRNFVRWFGESKVTDNGKTMAQGGKPLVVYHGTQSDFNAFDGGAFFTDDYYNADGYASGERVIEAFITLKTPLVIDAKGKKWDALESKHGDSTREIIAKLDIKKHDGVIFKNIKDSWIDDEDAQDAGTVYFAVTPTQVKSATGNTGDFNPTNPDIRFSRRTQADAVADAANIRNFKPKPLAPANWQQDLVRVAADSLIVVRDFVNELPISELGRQMLSGDLYRQATVRASLEKKAQDDYINPMGKEIRKFAAKHKLTLEQANHTLDEWSRANYAPEGNAVLLKNANAELEKLRSELDSVKTAKKAREDKLKSSIGVASIEDIAINDAKLIAFDAKIEKLSASLNDKTGQIAEIQSGKRGVGGLSDASAASIKADLEGQFGEADIRKMYAPLRGLLDWKLQIDVQSGRIDQATADKLQADSPNYVPTTGDPRAQAEHSQEFISGGGLNQAKDKTRTGRTTLSDAPTEAAIEAVIKSTALAGWSDFKAHINDVYESAVEQFKAQGHPVADAQKLAALELGFTRTRQTALTRTGDNVLIHRVKGNDYAFTFDDERIVPAIRREGVEDTPALLKPFAVPLSWFSRAVTQFMYGFAPINAVRDIWEKSELLRTRKFYDSKGNLIDSKKLARAAIAYSVSPSTMAATIGKAWNRGDATTVERQLLDKMIEDGGLSTWGQLFDRNMDTAKKEWLKQGRMDKEVFGAVSKFTEGYNNQFELISGFSVYRAMLDAGMNEKDAAASTLDLMNFKKRGEWSALPRALYAFANPVMQGSLNLTQALKTRTGQIRLAGYMTAFLVIAAALREIDDEDPTGKKKSDSLGDWVTERSIPIPIGGGKYFKIPVGFGLPQFALGIAGNLFKWGTNEATALDTVGELAKVGIKTYSPTGTSNIQLSKEPMAYFLQAFSPTLAKGFVQVGTDVNNFGGKISPFFDNPNKLHSDQGKVGTPDIYKDTAKFMQRTFGMDTYPERIKTISDSLLVGPIRYLLTSVQNDTNAKLGREERPNVLAPFVAKYSEIAPVIAAREAADELKQVRLEQQSRLKTGEPPLVLDANMRKKMAAFEDFEKTMNSERDQNAAATRRFNEGGMTEVMRNNIRVQQGKDQLAASIKFVTVIRRIDGKNVPDAKNTR